MSTATDFVPGAKPDAAILRLTFQNGAQVELVVVDPERAANYYKEYEADPARSHNPLEWIGVHVASNCLMLHKVIKFRPADVVCCEKEQHPLSIYETTNEPIPAAESLVS